MDKPVIEVKDISMMFNSSTETVDSIKEYIIRLFKKQLFFKEFWALRNISFSISHGEAVGVVGLNGAGKSTLLKLIARVLVPTSGTVILRGNVAPLIELGAGFDGNLTGRENIFLNGLILGYTKNEILDCFNEILEFSELQEFIDMPLKNYSSGMIARLGFSIATMKQPDILIVDEILGVGDYKFKLKCQERMNHILNSGATIIYVSHSIDSVRSVCQRVIWLDRGYLVMDGPSNVVCDKYSGI